MRPILAIAAIALAIALPAAAALQPGAKGPDFTAQGYKAGQAFSFTLSKELKKGPVVLYFFPAANTPGCNAEAGAFAQAIDDFKAAGATVIGMTAGNLGEMKAMSEKECAGKFGIAVAPKAVIDGYDVHLKKADGSLTGVTDRTSFVIAPGGRVLSAYTDMNYAGHVKNALDAVRKYKAKKKG
ncbi:MAG: redoxin domain-containing protein [Sphingomonas sp.]